MIDNQRQIDLLRYCRAKLHNENFISDKEYSWLLLEEDRGGVTRLERYDTIRARLIATENALSEDLANIISMGKK